MSVAETNSTCLQSLVREQIDAWRSGSHPDAAVFLAEHPELETNKSLVLDLVLEEYCLRAAAGDTLVKSTFCERFPAYQKSIVKMIEVQEFLDQCPEFAAHGQRATWPQPGERFLGYDIVELLGSGALARVYLAREPALGRRVVVIKVSRFGAAEAETLGKLSHPNIVPIHSVQHDSVTGWTAICMPLVGTATAVDLLDAAFANGPPRDGSVIARVGANTRTIAGIPRPTASEEQRQWRGPYADAIARLGLQLAEGLQQAHAAGIRHHDIKPSNVLLTWSGRPMLLDFNLSTDEAAATERIGGTLPYMAPELIAGLLENRCCSPERLDPRCDVYSLGAVLYELLSGRLPARPDGADKLPLDAYRPWLASKQLPTPPLRAHNPAIDQRLEAIVLQCLALDPAGRFATAAELAAELRTYLSLPLVARRFIGRNRRGFLAAGIALALAGSATAAYVGSLKPYPERLLDEGLAAYERGDYRQALAIFDRCVDFQRTWPEARFARGQTLLRLERWDDARADFTTLKSVHKGWALALTGYCHMRAKNDLAAFADYRGACDAGLSDIRLLVNYADVQRRRRQYTSAVEIYSKALDVDPANGAARRGRARSYYCIAMAQAIQSAVPDPQAFADAQEDIRLNPDSFEPLYLAAVILGYAVKMDLNLIVYRERGSDCLKQALEAGLPRELYDADASRFEPLKTDEIQPLIDAAPHLKKGAFLELYPHQDFPPEAEWKAFLQAVGSATS